MKTIQLTQISSFLENSSFVLYGVSSKPHKMGNSILKELSEKGVKIYPVHRDMESFENHKCYKSISEIPELPNAAIICTKDESTSAILDELHEKGIRQVWLQQGAASEMTINEARSKFENLIYGKCIMMFANQRGIHKFHSRILKIFGKYPKN